MMKKIVFSLLLCSSLLGLSACEDKAEKRAKLEAQYEHYFTQAGLCGYSVYNEPSPDEKKKCDEASKKAKEIKAELDKLNGIN